MTHSVEVEGLVQHCDKGKFRQEAMVVRRVVMVPGAEVLCVAFRVALELSIVVVVLEFQADLEGVDRVADVAVTVDDAVGVAQRTRSDIATTTKHLHHATVVSTHNARREAQGTASNTSNCSP